MRTISRPSTMAAQGRDAGATPFPFSTERTRVLYLLIRVTDMAAKNKRAAIPDIQGDFAAHVELKRRARAGRELHRLS
jgi:hypothetical protein